MKDSLWVEWGSNEKMLLQESWKNGLRNGKHAKWDSDGHLIEVGDFSNDKKDGAWKLNWIYINERQKGYFRNDYKNGGWIESGSMKRTYRYICSGEYLDGKKNGIWIEMCRPWDREFKSFQNQYYENGNLIKTEPNLELEKAYKKMLKNKGKTEDMQLKKLIEIYKWE
jgi:antitoxin component YwqK of YwqJK toxin-antitoxin module